MSQPSELNSHNNSAIAIIGIAGYFPGASDLDTFWQNLCAGVESIKFFTDEELLEAGIDATILAKPNYVKAKAVLSDIDKFDASFFGYSPREAEIMDPQQRLFLQCAWEALENAGYNSQTYSGAIGVYAGASEPSYLLENLYFHPGLSESVDKYQLLLANGRDFLPTRVAYQLNLKGPAVNIQTACSTSLVAVHEACQSLLDGECDMALAGGVSISIPHKSGYLYQDGMILSPDGHCRAFDALAQGTVNGSGVGIVLLKLLEDAITDGDHIHALIRGSAINNDGADKIGYTAPSISGQTKVIAEAQEIAGIHPETITYIETHGTGTPLGDPIEIAALTQVFRDKTEKIGFCSIGSLKTNLGHLDAAAGVASLIKTVLSLKQKQIPPSLHFENPNPEIDFSSSPFSVNTKLTPWETNGTPRRAGVSSFGIGGTNAHIILEEFSALPQNKTVKERSLQLLVLSAKSSTALDSATNNFVRHLQQYPELNLADVAYTLGVGRQSFKHRRMIVAASAEDAAYSLNFPSTTSVLDERRKEPQLVFMFSGQGSQYVNMGKELYQSEPTFRKIIDYCCEQLKSYLGLDLRDILYPSNIEYASAQEQLQKTEIAQPALFAIEYALAQLWIEWGVQPVAAIGHSVGEYTAACLAGVFSLDDALALLSVRGQLMQKTPSSSMLAVSLSEAEIKTVLDPPLELACINGSTQCTVAGPTELIENLQIQLAAKGIECRCLHTSHGFHSSMMESIVSPFRERVQQVSLHPPQLPFISNVTGSWIENAEAIDPNYWAQHLRQTVRFADGLKHLLNHSEHILLEVGPGRTLTTFAQQHSEKVSIHLTVSSLPHPKQAKGEMEYLLNTAGQLWMNGVKINWSGFYCHQQRCRLPLPTYPFERRRYWIDPPQPALKLIEGGVAISQAWFSIIEASHLKSQQGLESFNNPDYVKKLQFINQLSTVFFYQAFREMGVFQIYQRQFTYQEICKNFSIQPAYYQMILRGLKALVKQGLLQEHQNIYTLHKSSPEKELNILAEKLRLSSIDNPAILELVQSMGSNLAAILIGKIDPRELLFTPPLVDKLLNYYQESAESLYFVSLIQAVVRNLIQSLPSSARLNILEVGGGTGSTTKSLLPILPLQQTRYLFTDVGKMFVKQAQQEFQNYPFMEYELLDLNSDPQEQGFSLHSFDLIIASQVLHATKNLERTLRRVRSLLKPNGILLLWEGTDPNNIAFDVVFPLGDLIETDNFRSSPSIFLTLEQWNKALQGCGFNEVVSLPKVDTFPQHILVAKADDSTMSRSVILGQGINQTNVFTDQQPRQSPLNHARPNLNQVYATPRDWVEQNLVKLWQNCLGIEPVGIYDNFFELGGDSLSAVQLTSNLHQVLQIKISSKQLLENPTVEALAKVVQETSTNTDISLKENAKRAPSSLVTIQSKGSRPPLFCIHAGGGHVLFYERMSHYLGEDWPVYGLQARGLDGKEKPLTRIEAMAESYLKAVKSIQPNGPYHLCGSSFGGLVAFEIAHQLIEAGESVALLSLIDIVPISDFWFNQLDNAIILAWLGVDLNIVSTDEFKKLVETLKQLNNEEQFQYFLNLAKQAKIVSSTAQLDELLPLIQVFKANLQAMNDYRPKVYPHQITVFEAEETFSLFQSNISPISSGTKPSHAWEKLSSKPIKSYVIPGNHYTILKEPNVSILAEHLSSTLSIFWKR